MENYQETTSNRIKNWFGESVIIKLILICIVSLLLLIPSSWIQDLIRERQSRQEEVIREISDKWAGEQLIEGPVMVIPYKTLVLQKDDKGQETYKESLSNIYILPETLDIQSKADPEILHRGLFDAVVYNSKIKVEGKFSPLEIKKSGINPKMVQWDKARVVIGLSDLKGLKNNPVIHFDDKAYAVEPDFSSLNLFSNNLVIQPDQVFNQQNGPAFHFDLDLRGSSELTFLHLGKSTTVRMEGPWNNPSFTGRYLPEDRQVTADGFNATWKLPYFNRPFSQQWLAENSKLQTGENSSFGVKFILPVDQYQKTMRTAKYAILIILLTFVSLFFTEILNKQRVHLLQYVLIGAAMIIYYSLLLSFSEQVGYNTAYLIASVATVTLVSVFIGSLLQNKKPAFIFAAILSIFYTFIYVLIQLQDLALLFGSVGLFITVAVLMYLSAKIDWGKKTMVLQA